MASFLADSGYEAVHWSVVGNNAAKDREICEYARIHGFVLLTNDMDFPQILAHTHQSGPSVVLLRGEPLTPEQRGTAMLNALQSSENELNAGAILTLDWSDQPRARLLPLP